MLERQVDSPEQRAAHIADVTAEHVWKCSQNTGKWAEKWMFAYHSALASIEFRQNVSKAYN